MYCIRAHPLVWSFYICSLCRPICQYCNFIYASYIGPSTSTVILYMHHIWAHPLVWSFCICNLCGPMHQYCHFVYIAYMGPCASTVILYMQCIWAHPLVLSLVNAKGLQNPKGMGQGYIRVRVRVQNSEPFTNPYPQGRVGGFPGVGETE